MSVISEVPEHVIAEMMPEWLKSASDAPKLQTVRAADREEKREHISIRTTPAIKSALQEAASKSGRSLTQEIEFRLETSFMGREIAKMAAEIAAETVAKVLAQHGLTPAKKEG